MFVPGAYEYVVLNCLGVYNNEHVDVSQSQWLGNGYFLTILCLSGVNKVPCVHRY